MVGARRYSGGDAAWLRMGVEESLPGREEVSVEEKGPVASWALSFSDFSAREGKAERWAELRPYVEGDRKGVAMVNLQARNRLR